MAEMIEGPEAFKRFDKLMRTVLKVPHSVIQARVQAHREQVAKNPNRRGPKRKPKPNGASRAPAV
jgi:hypothetical protein